MPKSQPLSGRLVAVTRASDQASELGAMLTQLGADVLELPLIKVSKDISLDQLADVMLELGSYDWIVFTSANGVRHFFEEFRRIFDDIRSLGLLRIACVGEATARAIKAMHLKVECQPPEATAEMLADALIETGSLDSAKVLVITGNLNREILVSKLEAARAIVDQLQVYKTEVNDLSAEPAAADFRTRGADAILFASSSAAQSYAEQTAAVRLETGAKRPLAGSIGPQTSDTLRKNQIGVDFEAKTPSLEALIEALVKALK